MSQSLFKKKTAPAVTGAAGSSPSAPAAAPAAASPAAAEVAKGKTLAEYEQVGNPRIAVEPLSKAKITAEMARLKQYVSKLDQYSLKGSMALKVPITSKQQECPTSNGKPWKAYRLPHDDFDDKLKQQWTIDRKDYRGRNTKLFCYPDGEFDGQNFNMPAEANNPAVDLNMFTYVPQAEASESLRTLIDLIMPQNSVSEVERQRARMTDTIVQFQNDAKTEKLKQESIEKLAKVLATCESYVGLSNTRKAVVTKKKAKKLINDVHHIAIANIGLTEATKSKCTDVGGTPENKLIHGLNVLGCVPADTFKNLENDKEFVTLYEKNKVKQFLIKYAQEIVNLREKIQPANWQDAFFKLTADQKRVV